MHSLFGSHKLKQHITTTLVPSHSALQQSPHNSGSQPTAMSASQQLRPTRAPVSDLGTSQLINAKKLAILQDYQQLQSIAEVATKQQLAESTIVKHLADAILNGYAVSVAPFHISSELRTFVYQQLEDHYSDNDSGARPNIKTLKDACSERHISATYEQINILSAQYRSQKAQGQTPDPSQLSQMTHSNTIVLSQDDVIDMTQSSQPKDEDMHSVHIHKRPKLSSPNHMQHHSVTSSVRGALSSNGFSSAASLIKRDVKIAPSQSPTSPTPMAAPKTALVKPPSPPPSQAFSQAAPTSQQSTQDAPFSGKVTIRSHEILFPFKPYGQQMSYMNKLLQAIIMQQNALLESPTGSGKTLSLLCAALAWQQKEKQIWMKQSVSKRADQLMMGIAPKHDKSLEDIQCSPTSGDLDEYDPLDDLSQINRGTMALNAQTMFGGSTQLSQFAMTQSKPSGAAADKQLKDSLKAAKAAKRPRIFYTSRTHSQLTQVVKELQGTDYSPTMAILASRDKLCINEDVRHADNINDACKETCKAERCSYHEKYARVAADSRLQQPHDIEELLDVAQKVGGCAYYGAKAMKEQADIVFCPYSYLVDSLVREAMGIDLEGAVVILDEAHNAEQVGIDSVSREFTLQDFDVTMKQLTGLIAANQSDNKLKTTFELLREALRPIQEWFIEATETKLIRDQDGNEKLTMRDQEMIHMLASVGLDSQKYNTLQQLASELFEDASEKSGGGPPDASKIISGVAKLCISNLFTVLGCLYSFGGKYIADYRLTVMKDTRQEGPSNFDRGGSRETVITYKLCFWAMNPAIAFEPIAKVARSLILTSGTLSPLSSFASELGTKFEVTLENTHVIGSEQALPLVISHTEDGTVFEGTFANKNNMAYVDGIGETIYELIQTIPDGVLVFFSSYFAMNTMIERWKQRRIYSKFQEYKRLFFEPRGTGPDFDRRVDEYNNANDAFIRDKKGETYTGGMFFAVARGKLSEGIDFSDGAGRAVIIIGLPYAAAKDPKGILKKAHNDELRQRGKQVISGKEWYELQCYRAVNQSVGRALRHKNDYGSIILLDQRYTQERVRNNLSKWLRNELNRNFAAVSSEQAVQRLGEFFQRWQLKPPGDGEVKKRIETKVKGGKRPIAKRGRQPRGIRGALQNQASQSAARSKPHIVTNPDQTPFQSVKRQNYSQSSPSHYPKVVSDDAKAAGDTSPSAFDAGYVAGSGLTIEPTQTKVKAENNSDMHISEDEVAEVVADEISMPALEAEEEMMDAADTDSPSPAQQQQQHFSERAPLQSLSASQSSSTSQASGAAKAVPPSQPSSPGSVASSTKQQYEATGTHTGIRCLKCRKPLVIIASCNATYSDDVAEACVSNAALGPHSDESSINAGDVSQYLLTLIQQRTQPNRQLQPSGRIFVTDKSCLRQPTDEFIGFSALSIGTDTTLTKYVVAQADANVTFHVPSEDAVYQPLVCKRDNTLVALYIVSGKHADQLWVPLDLVERVNLGGSVQSEDVSPTNFKPFASSKKKRQQPLLGVSKTAKPRRQLSSIHEAVADENARSEQDSLPLAQVKTERPFKAPASFPVSKPREIIAIEDSFDDVL